MFPAEAAFDRVFPVDFSRRGASMATQFYPLKHRTEWRQVVIITAYMGVLATAYFVPQARTVWTIAIACWLSFLNSVVIHNSLHQGPFVSQRLNYAWRMLLSFGALYPASAKIPSHNLVHHHFDDDGQLDWADPSHVKFRWNLLNLIHFPNVAGPRTFNGVQRWSRLAGRGEFRAQYTRELAFAFSLTIAALIFDFWTALFFIVVPQLYGARCILRINLIQHDGCDTTSEWNHSRNFVGRAFNWVMCNNGLHTIHHNRAGLHWSDLWKWHEKECVPRIDPALNERSMVWYLFRTYVLNPIRPPQRDVAAAERDKERVDILPREVRRAEVEAAGTAI